MNSQNMPSNNPNNPAFFQQTTQSQDFQKIMLNQFFNAYMLCCQQNGLNPKDENAYNQYVKINFNVQNNNPPIIIGANNNQNVNKNNNDSSEEPEGISCSGHSISNVKVINIPFQNPNNKYSNMGGLTNEIITVTMKAVSGFTIIINIPKCLTFEDLLINFSNKMGIPLDTIEKELVFLYNGEKLETKSKLPISSLFKTSNAQITILEYVSTNGS